MKRMIERALWRLLKGFSQWKERMEAEECEAFNRRSAGAQRSESRPGEAFHDFVARCHREDQCAKR